MTKHTLATSVLCMACSALIGVRGQDVAKDPGDKLLLKVAGELTRDDPVDPVLKRGFHKVYAVKLTAGGHYQIDLVSDDFDAYLRFENSAGKRLAEDDDSGGDLNARLNFQVNSGDAFRIVVTTFDAAKTGKFLLTVKQLGPASIKQNQLQAQATALDAEAVRLYHQGKLREATTRLEKALELMRQGFPTDAYPQGHPLLARAFNNLGVVYGAQGEIDKAVTFYRDALKMRTALYPKAKDPEGHPAVVQSLNNLGLLLQLHGQPAKAEPFLRDALAMNLARYTRAKYPEGHADLAASLGNLGRLLHDQGDYAGAEPLLREALAMNAALYPRARFPQGHPELATSLNNLAGLLRERSEYAKAEPMFREALAITVAFYPRSKFPEGHADLARSLLNLGLLYRDQGEYDKAEPLLRDASAMYAAVYPKAQFPQGHPQVASSLSNLGLLLHRRGEYGRAEPIFREALAMRAALYPKAKYPQGHADLVASVNNLGLLFHGQGEYAKAEPLLRDALAMATALYPKAKYPQGHTQLASSISNLGAVLRDQGEHGKAEPFLRDALAMREALYPKAKYPRGHPELALSLSMLGALLHDQGEYARAEPFMRAAVDMDEALYPEAQYPHGHPELARSLDNLGLLHQHQVEYGKAEPLLRRALAMRAALYPKAQHPGGHADLARSLNNLGGLLHDQEDYAQAERFLRDALAMREMLYSGTRYPRGHPELAGSHLNLGSLLRDRGAYAKAEPFLRKAVAMYEALYPGAQYPEGHRALAISLDHLGGLLREQGEYGKADPVLRDAVAMITRLTNRLAEVVPEPVALNAIATFPFSRDSLVSATELLAGADARTYTALWQSRSAVTRVYQRRHLALIAAATDDAVRTAFDRLQSLRRQYEELILAPPPKDPADHAERLAELNKKINAAERELLTQVPALKHHADLAKLGPDALQDRLPADTVLIDFLRYTKLEQDPAKPGEPGRKRAVRYLAFVVSRHDIRRVELDLAADIDPAVREWRATITAKVPPGNETARQEHEVKLAHHGALLRRLLWERIEKRLPAGTTTVYLAADAELTQLPWAALPGKGKDRVLLDDYALAVLPHGPYLLEQLAPSPPRSAKRPPAAESLLLVGGIRYDDQTPATVAAARGEDVVEQKHVWDYLHGTEQERQLLTKLLQKGGPKLTANLSGSTAATDRLRLELARCRYAHIGTHGFFADARFRSVLERDPKIFDRKISREGHIGQRIGAGARDPLLLSGLVCAGANRPETPERGILSGYAITGLLLDDLYLATLSACDTGIGDVAGGEGVFGLQRAFHIAGCKNVVASLWKVDDAATAALMVRFYGYLFPERRGQETPAERGLPPIEALRRAQLDLYRHPELIPAWAKGEERGPVRPRPATAPPADTPRELLTSAGRAPIRLWAAFTLSGAGRDVAQDR